jgi:AAA+ superfamily predicted ATPase
MSKREASSIAAVPMTWLERNQRHMGLALRIVRTHLERFNARAKNEPEPEVPETLEPAIGFEPALEHLQIAFDLSDFERDVLILCAGMELESAFPMLCGVAHNDPQKQYASFGLALSALPGAHWSALAPESPLRHWKLIEVGSGYTLASSPLRISERVLHHLTGIGGLDARLTGLLEPIRHLEQAILVLAPSHETISEQIANAWQDAPNEPTVQVLGPDASSRRAIAMHAAHTHNLRLHAMPAEHLPNNPLELETLLRLIECELSLSNSVLLLECDQLEHSNEGSETRSDPIPKLIDHLNARLIISGRERRWTSESLNPKPNLTLNVQAPNTNEQRRIWQSILGEHANTLEHTLEQIATQFNLGAGAIRAIANEAIANETQNEHDPHEIERKLWTISRTRSRPKLEHLAQRLHSSVNFEDLILPEAQRQTLQDITSHVRQRATVHERWGFANKSNRGLGITALFAGVSGTGKTMAAEVIANELELDLYRIDLSSVVSKYIGETEKNLRQIFDAAEEGGAILLFDEADALFGKRSEVKDSHDRHANIEVSYLLQRMEAYRGLAILTTNLKSALDHAFLRRIRFVVQFPFPDAPERERIWQRVFPKATPTEGLEYAKLARLNVAGGNIRNTALNAAFLAAEAGEAVGMKHLLQAAHSEYAKLEKPLTESEVGGWL